MIRYMQTAVIMYDPNFDPATHPNVFLTKPHKRCLFFKVAIATTQLQVCDNILRPYG